MLLMHNNRYLPLTGLLTLLLGTIQPAPIVSVLPEKKHREFFKNISVTFHEIFYEIFHAKKFREILHHYMCINSHCTT